MCFQFNRFRKIVAIMMIALALGAATVALAQSSVPTGSYQETCRNIAVSGRSLVGECQKMNGEWVGASLPRYRSCVDDIANLDGVLVCTSSRFPAGSYQRSCTSISYDANDDFLLVRCWSLDGRWLRNDVTDVSGCVGDLGNLDGTIVCSDREGLPDGTYQQSCNNIFIALTNQQQQLVAVCRKIDGRWNNTVLTTKGGLPMDYRDCTSDIANLDGSLKCS